MGIKDTVTTKYMRQNDIFADAFNYYVYHGRQVIRPDSLRELDTREIALPYGGKKGAAQPIQRIRDLIKTVTAMTDGERAYLILAIENQSHIHYAMPVKNMTYDVLQYVKQVERTIASHKMSKDYKGTDGDEFLSGFMKCDKLMPVLTLVIYFDSKHWDGPLSLHEMFVEQDSEIMALIPDYKVNLIAPYAIDDSEFDKFQTTLKEVLKFIKYADREEKLANVVSSDEKFKHLGRNEVDVLNACVGANITMKKKEEECNVCKAIEDMTRHAAERATKVAEEKAAKAVKAAEEKAAREKKQERISTLLNNVKSLMNNAGFTMEQSMNLLDISEQEQKELIPLL